MGVQQTGRAPRATDRSGYAALVMVGLMLCTGAVFGGLFLLSPYAAGFGVLVCTIVVSLDAGGRDFSAYTGLGLPLMPNAAGWTIATFIFPVVSVPCYLIERADLPPLSAK